MKYKLPHKNGSYLPNVYDYLAGLKKDELYFSDHDLMHPADIYMTVFDEVIQSAIRLTRGLDSMKSDHSKRRDEHFNSLILGFLFSISNYIDGCQSIVKTFYPKGCKLPGKINREFKNQCKTYIDYINPKINYVKHRHREVATCLFEWEQEFILAYYITGLLGGDKIGPDPDLHKDPNCAISLNWDIPYHITNVYFLGAILESLIRKNSKLKSNLTKANSQHNQKPYKELFNLVYHLERNLLPDEFYKEQASVKSLKSDCFELSYPSKVKANNNKQHIMNTSMTTKIGITAQGFVLPYSVRKDYRLSAKNC